MSINKKLLFATALVVILAIGVTISVTHKNPPKPTSSAPIVIVPPNTADIFTLVNAERTKAGLSVLADDPIADRAANDKCTDMVTNNYFAHVSPSGVRGLSLINTEGENTARAGENLAYGFKDSASTVRAWMNSPEHRANILNAGFDEVGTAVCESSNFQRHGHAYVVVQEFAHEL